jgi:hypothetical protein
MLILVYVQKDELFGYKITIDGLYVETKLAVQGSTIEKVVSIDLVYNCFANHNYTFFHDVVAQWRSACHGQ